MELYDIYDIIDSLDKAIKLDGKFIINRSMTTNNQFPAYKKFNYIIWKVKNSSDKIKVFTYVETINTANVDITKCWEYTDKNFMTALFKWIIKEGHNYANE